MTDKQKLAAMRKLGVIWRPGSLPRYVMGKRKGRMSEQDAQKADALYDSMSDAFVDKMTMRNAS